MQITINEKYEILTIYLHSMNYLLGYFKMLTNHPYGIEKRHPRQTHASYFYIKCIIPHAIK